MQKIFTIIGGIVFSAILIFGGYLLGRGTAGNVRDINSGTQQTIVDIGIARQIQQDLADRAGQLEGQLGTGSEIAKRSAEQVESSRASIDSARIAVDRITDGSEVLERTSSDIEGASIELRAIYNSVIKRPIISNQEP